MKPVLPQRSLSLLFILLLHVSFANSVQIQHYASSSGALENPSMAPAALMANKKWGEKSGYQEYHPVKAPVKDTKPELPELDPKDHRRREAPGGHSPGGGHGK